MFAPGRWDLEHSRYNVDVGDKNAKEGMRMIKPPASRIMRWLSWVLEQESWSRGGGSKKK